MCIRDRPCTVLSSQATLDITGKLTGAVGVTSAMPEVGRLVAQGLGYTASEADRAAFTSDDPSYTVALEGCLLYTSRSHYALNVQRWCGNSQCVPSPHHLCDIV